LSILHSPDSDYARERAKWECYPTVYSQTPGRNPSMFTEYPLMIYRAKRPPQGGREPIIEHVIVDNEQEERNMASRGFVRGPDHAVEALEASERELARAAAERAYSDQRMSDRAQDEAAKADAQTISHLGEILETPIRRRVKRAAK